MFKGTSVLHWKYELQERTFYHFWWMCKKNSGVKFKALVQMILNNISLRREVFLLGVMDEQLGKSYGIWFFCMRTIARLLYAQRWKEHHPQWKNEVKLMELVEMAKRKV